MSYTKLPNMPNLAADETVAALLDSGHRVAVSLRVARDPASQRNSYHARARQIHPDGATVLDATGQPVVSEIIHSMSADAVATVGDFSVLREMVLLVLGEPATRHLDGAALIDWSSELRRDASIRTAIASAARTGVVPNLAALI